MAGTIDWTLILTDLRLHYCGNHDAQRPAPNNNAVLGSAELGAVTLNIKSQQLLK